MPLPSGARLGPYEIVALVDAGGMGEVYRARDTRLDRTVAIKVLPQPLADTPGFRARFEREARAISSVDHRHICALYDIGTERVRLPPSAQPRVAGVPGTIMPAPEAASPEPHAVDFLVMQYVEGLTLAERIRQGPIPVAEALALARQIAAGVEAAHERGILHRDLKPSNIKLAADGEVKILDFGLAKALDPAWQPGASDPGPTLSTPATQFGVMLGTAAYMSPEQARGKALDKRTDIWAFGCVLFEMVAGRPVFDGETIADVLAKVIDREPDWQALPAGTPRRVRDLLGRCLRKDASRRLRDIGDARLELEQAGETETPAGEEPEPARRRSAALPWSIAAVAVLVAAGALSALALVGLRPHPPARAPMRFSAVTNFSGVEAQPSLSPDGRSVAFISNRDGQWDIYVGLVTGGSLVRVTNDPNFEARPRWSPDGTHLIFARLNDTGLYDIRVVPAFSGPDRRLVANGVHPTWSPDGRSIAYSSDGSIWIADASGANPRAVTHPERPFADFQASFSHDGRSLAFVRRRGGISGDAPYGALAVVDLGTATLKYLTGDDALALSPAWSPDDRFVYFTSSHGGALNIWKIPAASGQPEQITAGQGDDTDIDLSADGKRLVFSSYRVNVNLAEVSLDPSSRGRSVWLTGDSARGEAAPRYSPDGRRIAYFSNRNGAERESIWVMDSTGANAVKPFEDTRANIFPRWTADGQELLFMSRTASAPARMASLVELGELRRVSIGGGAPQPLPVKPWSPSWGDIARDGRIVYRASRDSGEVYDPRTNQRRPIANLLGDPSWAPDGRAIAFAVPPAAGSTQAGLWIEPDDGPRRQVFRGWVLWFAWTSGGQLLVLEGKANLKGVLWQVEAFGEPKVVLPEVSLPIRHTDVSIAARFDVHPDGRRIVIEALESFEADIGLIDNVR